MASKKKIPAKQKVDSRVLKREAEALTRAVDNISSASSDLINSDFAYSIHQSRHRFSSFRKNLLLDEFEEMQQSVDDLVDLATDLKSKMKKFGKDYNDILCTNQTEYDR